MLSTTLYRRLAFPMPDFSNFPPNIYPTPPDSAAGSPTRNTSVRQAGCYSSPPLLSTVPADDVQLVSPLNCDLSNFTAPLAGNPRQTLQAICFSIGLDTPIVDIVYPPPSSDNVLSNMFRGAVLDDDMGEYEPELAGMVCYSDMPECSLNLFYSSLATIALQTPGIHLVLGDIYQKLVLFSLTPNMTHYLQFTIRDGAIGRLN